MNVSRETITTYEIILYMIASDYCWNNFDCNSYCDVGCIHEVSTGMLAIAINMVYGGEY